MNETLIKAEVAAKAGVSANDIKVVVKQTANGTEVVITPIGGDAGEASARLENVTTTEWKDMGFEGKPSPSPVDPEGNADDDGNKNMIIYAAAGAVVLLLVGGLAFFVHSRMQAAKQGSGYLDMGGVLQDPTSARMENSSSYEMYNRQEAGGASL